jgi:hypothetical protein
LIFTTRGSVVSKNLTIDITSAVPTAGYAGPFACACWLPTGLTHACVRDAIRGDSSSSDAALIGGIVGGVGGAFLLLCLLMLLLLLLVLSRRRRSAFRKLTQPNYETVAFGDVKEDVALPKRQAGVSVG